MVEYVYVAQSAIPVDRAEDWDVINEAHTVAH